MQVKAIFNAAKRFAHIDLEIMIPFVMCAEELRILHELVSDIASKYENIRYSLGTMIELPRAALTADKIARYADFFSFGTNDLTQTTFGLSRDDTSKLLALYRQKNILENDPFKCLDREGTGELMTIATQKSRKVKPHIKLGICGEQGSSVEAIALCLALGFEYISCSPYKISAAKLLCAQQTIIQRRNNRS